MDKIVIVGGRGFIGRSLSKKLEISGQEVLILDRLNPAVSSNELSKQIEGANTVVWLAARVNPILAELRPDLIELEISEWRVFLSLLQAHNISAKVVYLSSGGCVYSDSKTPFTELSQAHGINEYGRLKVRMEESLQVTELPFTILRVSNVYGHGQPHGRGQGVIAEWGNALKTRKNLKVYGPLNSFRDYIHIDDVCEAIIQVIKLEDQRHVFNLGSGIPTHLGEILEIFLSIGIDPNQISHDQKRTFDRSGYYLDISKLTGALNWKPKIPIMLGLKAILQSNEYLGD
jgi:UDP-glucose 4-epimerase